MKQLLKNKFCSLQLRYALIGVGFCLFPIVLPAQGWLITDYQYFVDQAESGGLLAGFTPTYSQQDQFYGPVHSNADIIVSQFGCPHFGDYVETAGSIHTGMCGFDIFEESFRDSVDVIELPSAASLNTLKMAADYVYTADTKVNRPDTSLRDTLMMTKIQFSPGMFNVRQWEYIVPPYTTEGQGDGTFLETYFKYHNHEFGWDTCTTDGFHHFDFDPPTNSDDYYLDAVVIADSGIIYIKGGPVLVETHTGARIRGRYTIITDYRTPYRAHYDNLTTDYIYNNIWLMKDIVYEGSYTNGYIQLGNPNSLGLISGANIIVANTSANGARNSANGTDIRINAAMITLRSSFMAQYWQNTLTDYWQPHPIPTYSTGDGRGLSPFHEPTGSSDIRGDIMIYGSLAQQKRGLVKRNNPGPYAVYPGVGYERDYHYDENLRHRLPPGFELLRDSVYTQECLSYFPLHLGDSWQYQVTPLEATGPELAHTEFLEVMDELEMTNGKIYYEIQNNYSAMSEYVRIDTTFLRVYMFTTSEEEPLGFDTLLYDLNRPRYDYQPVQLLGSDYFKVFNSQAPTGNWGDHDHALDHYGGEEESLVFRLSSGVGLSYKRDAFTSGDTSQLIYTNIAGVEYGEYLVGIESENQSITPAQLLVLNIFPNPFNPSTTIRFSLPQNSDFQLAIYDMNGKMIRSYSVSDHPAGWSNFMWDGKNSQGNRVSAGIYFCSLTAGDLSSSIKMVLVK
ncbi:MAG: T9SS type A sorting domain-containing protein [Candidatus Marinimicrobia bacterium]|nr:T9SS type A sorting domain-containing protein [Candidatus Neomarinimicrobiota bacterium]MBT3574514.1 T9SS type A sorting domain-containing protein [Candidatus Neomarinimicrobiota bacterium]MBT3679787.1 T9SS type A sorting domain-containing protein [Candidatus Neomarinimicrobiota bacterium]MBT3950458.1 T9SS type A sorting domain-containing protein [Candidatus Neomarinimicrobiota bacterium]MBT4253956.1 T9SS type A sorting domain-containing protein [Candidatus Neomarinimicrobiota bacterium]